MPNLGYVSSFNINGNELSLKDAALTEIVEEIIEAIGANNGDISERINDLHNRSFDNVIEVEGDFSRLNESNFTSINDGLYKVKYVTTSGSGDNEVKTLNNSAILIQNGTTQYIYVGGCLYNRIKMTSPADPSQGSWKTTWTEKYLTKAPVTSVNGMTGAVVLNIPVTSVNGMTGAVTITHPVTSVNGQTGAVTVNVPVTSVNGQTGAVSLSIPDDNNLVHKTGNETISGNKTFNDNISFFVENMGNILSISNGTIKFNKQGFDLNGEGEFNGIIYEYGLDKSISLKQALDARNNLVTSVNGMTGAVSITIPDVPVTSVNGMTGAVTITETQLSKGTATGTGNAVTDVNVSNHQITLVKGATYATPTEVQNAVATGIASLVNSAPETLDTLNELAAALGDDPNFATTIANQIGQKYTKPSTGIPASDLEDGIIPNVPVQSVNGMTGAVTINVPVQSVNGQTGAVTIDHPVTSVNGQTGAVSLSIPDDNNLVHKTGNETISGTKSFQDNIYFHGVATGEVLFNNELYDSIIRLKDDRDEGWVQIIKGGGTNATTLQAALDERNNLVTSVNGMTGAVTITHPVTSVNGQTGAVTITHPVTSVNGQTGAVTIDTGVTSFNGATGAITYTAPVTSVDGKTGAVTITHPITSVNGQTGAVSLSLGDTNVIETVKVNGTALTPDSNKAVDITVPTKITTDVDTTYLEGNPAVIICNVDKSGEISIDPSGNIVLYNSGSTNVNINTSTGKAYYNNNEIATVNQIVTPPVTSVNGMTGAVTITHPVTSVNGQTGTVSLSLGDTNVIETVKVNGTALTPDSNKAVNITSVPASIVTQDETHRFVSDTEKSTWTNKQNSLEHYTENNGHVNISTYVSEGDINIVNYDDNGGWAVAEAIFGSNGIELNAKQTFTGGGDEIEHTVTLSFDGFKYDNKQIATTDQIPSAVTESTVSGWGFTKNTGQVTSVNGATGAVTITHPVTSVNGMTGAVTITETQLSKATATGTGNAVTDINVSNHQVQLIKGATYATPTEVQNAVATGVASLVNSAPETLNTLNELAAALGNDENFATTVTNLIGQKYTKPSTGIPASDLEAGVIPTVPVQSVNGQTGAVNINVGVTSFNGATGAVTYTAPVTSVNGQTGAVTINTGVMSFNGATGAVTYTAPVTSVNGATGAVNLTIPTVNNSTVTITMNGNTVGTFTLNKSGNTTIDLGTVITSHQSIKTVNNESLVGTGNISINGLPTVTSSDNGKVLMVVNGAWTLVSPVTLYSGSGTPANSQGNNGDLYIQS